jgi:hypothetical protein
LRRGNWPYCWQRFRQKVENFEAANPQDINSLFTTIQGLHSNLNTPRETALTYEDFKSQHINALTKSANKRNKSKAENVNPCEQWKKEFLKQIEAEHEITVAFQSCVLLV